MAKTIVCVGNTSSGKTSAAFPNKKLGIKGLNPSETFFISVQKNELPMKGWKKKYTLFTKENQNGNLLISDNVNVVNSIINFVSNSRLDIKYLVLDDWSYLASNEYFRRSKEKGFDKFVDFGNIIFSTIQTCLKARPDLYIFITCHPEATKNPITGEEMYKIKTIGQTIDSKYTVEGAFNYVLFADSESRETEEETLEVNKYFITQSNGSTTAKTPAGVFDELRIPNDFGYIVDKIEQYENEDDEDDDK